MVVREENSSYKDNWNNLTPSLLWRYQSGIVVIWYLHWNMWCDGQKGCLFSCPSGSIYFTKKSQELKLKALVAMAAKPQGRSSRCIPWSRFNWNREWKIQSTWLAELYNIYLNDWGISSRKWRYGRCFEFSSKTANDLCLIFYKLWQGLTYGPHHLFVKRLTSGPRRVYTSVTHVDICLE